MCIMLILDHHWYQGYLRVQQPHSHVILVTRDLVPGKELVSLMENGLKVELNAKVIYIEDT